MKRVILLVFMTCCFVSAFAQQKKIVSKTTKEPTAEELYEKAFDYMYGRNGVIMDSVKAVELFEQSANMGFAKAQVERAYVEKSDSAALKWLLKAAAQDCPYAMRPLFGIYYNGRNDVPKNIDKAVKWLKKGAESGDVVCQWLLGFNYYTDVNSLGLPEDGKLATYWLEKAVAQNHDGAMEVLADMYDEGKLVKRDKQKANELYRKAAELGNYEAAYKLATAYGFGDGVDMDKVAAFNWMKKSAELGYAKAQLDLGFFFATGYACEKDETAAGYWWRLVLKNRNASEDERMGAQKNIEMLDE